ncbi:MAG: class I SAM-dependent methyltransferase [Gemmatimonadaceae bacterium]
MTDSAALRPAPAPSVGLTSRIINAFPTATQRAYARIRFLIIGPRFLREIARHLPSQGDVLEIGSGFGLTGLFLASTRPDLVIHGYDLDAKRIELAGQAAQRLGLPNIRFSVGDAARLTLTRGFDAAYAIDLIHHVPKAAVPEFLQAVHDRLQPGGCFVIKDVDNRPMYKRFMSWLTDRVMVGFDEPVYYWPTAELRAVLEGAGFTVDVRPLPDLLPYPHVLYVCRRS